MPRFSLRGFSRRAAPTLPAESSGVLIGVELVGPLDAGFSRLPLFPRTLGLLFGERLALLSPTCLLAGLGAQLLRFATTLLHACSLSAPCPEHDGGENNHSDDDDHDDEPRVHGNSVPPGAPPKPENRRVGWKPAFLSHI